MASSARSRSLVHVATLVVANLLVVCDSARAGIVWETKVDNGVENTNEVGIVAIGDVGPARFAVGYLKSENNQVCLKYRTYGVQEGPGAASPPQSTGYCSISGVVANTSPYMATPASGCLAPGKGALYSNVFAFVTSDAHVKLMFMSVCGSSWRQPTFLDVASGAWAAVATKGSASSGRALVAYVNNDQLLGRFYYYGVSQLGPEFVIRTAAANSFIDFTTVVYSPLKDQFFVGFREALRGGVSRDQCGIYNAAVSEGSEFAQITWPMGVDPQTQQPIRHGTCDGSKGLHYETVAYNPIGDGTHPGDGSYVWWRDGDDAKAVYNYKSDGTPSTAEVLHNENVFSNFLAHSYDTAKVDAIRYFVLHSRFDSSLSLWSVKADGTFVDLDEQFCGGSSCEHPMALAGLGFATAASYIKRGNGEFVLNLAISDWAGTGYAIPWQSGRHFEIGDDVVFGGNGYRVLQAHSAIAGLEPPNAYSLFARRLKNWAWTPQVLYAAGDEAVFAGRRYEALVAHQATSATTPNASPSYWTPTSGGACSGFTVTTNTYDRNEWWGTITFRNNGPNALTDYKVTVTLPSGVHCTAEPDAVPAGATLSPLTGSNPPHTVSNQCTFTWSAAPLLGVGSSKTFNYSTDSQSFSAASQVAVTDSLCGASRVACAAMPITGNSYDPHQWWGTMTFKNNQTISVPNYKVEFDVPEGKHCTAEPDAIPAGATLSPLNSAGTQTVSNHCIFTWPAGPTVSANSSKTFNYSTDSNDSAFTTTQSAGALDMCAQ